VSALKIRRVLRRQHRRLAVTSVVLLLAGLIAVHHGGALMNMQHDSGMGAVAEMCLGIFTAVGSAIVAAGLAVVALGRWRPAPRLLPDRVEHGAGVAVARARHGPATLSLLCVIRR